MPAGRLPFLDQCLWLVKIDTLGQLIFASANWFWNSYFSSDPSPAQVWGFPKVQSSTLPAYPLVSEFKCCLCATVSADLQRQGRPTGTAGDQESEIEKYYLSLAMKKDVELKN